MATPMTVMVAQIENLRPHPNADRLEVCDVLGWQMVIPKGTYTNGMKVPPDTLMARRPSVAPLTFARAWSFGRSWSACTRRWAGW